VSPEGQQTVAKLSLSTDYTQIQQAKRQFRKKDHQLTVIKCF